jgi:CubicO group peptidase (beta-lactamase class C family)
MAWPRHRYAGSVSWLRRILVGLGALVVLFVGAMGAWAWAIGPDAWWRVVTNGTTTVWDHLHYPGRATMPSPDPEPWAMAEGPEPVVTLDGAVRPVGEVMAEHDGLAMVVVRSGDIVYEWYAPGHDAATASMLFSVTKSITSLLVGAAIEDGFIGSADDPVTDYIPELAAGGFDAVTIEDALRMDTDSTYVEDDNPFGVHVEFNYTSDLEGDILALRVRDEAQEGFVYKSGDNAILGLILHRVLAPESITDYFQRRLLDHLGVEYAGMWSTDREDGLERTWCCLALAARDLARIGQMVIDGGAVDGDQIMSAEWLAASFAPAYRPSEWPADYAGSALTNYGYQWWLVGDSAVVALGKDGQYLYVDTSRDVVIVRTGTSQGGIGWLDLLVEIAAQR